MKEEAESFDDEEEEEEEEDGDEPVFPSDEGGEGEEEGMWEEKFKTHTDSKPYGE